MFGFGINLLKKRQVAKKNVEIPIETLYNDFISLRFADTAISGVVKRIRG